MQVPVSPKEVKDHNGDVEKCDKDFTKHTTLRKKLSKALVKKLNAKKNTFL